MDRLIVIAAAPLMLAACASAAPPPETGAEPPEYRVREPEQQCDDSEVQDHIGHRASAEAGQVLLELTGAKVLRWVPPDTAITMDYSYERLTVSYDADMIIESISCG